MPANLADLSALEQTYLGIVAFGLPPYRLVGDQWLRLDYLSAVTQALLEKRPDGSYLSGEGPEPQPEFLTTLKHAVRGLEEKEIVGTNPPSMFFAFDTPSTAIPNVDAIDPNAAPTIFDNFLAQQCMNMLLGHPQVYRFLMEKYAASSEQWQRLIDQGYGEGPHI